MAEWFPHMTSVLCLQMFATAEFRENKTLAKISEFTIFETQHEISNNVECAISKGSNQPALMRSLISAFACHLNIL